MTRARAFTASTTSPRMIARRAAAAALAMAMLGAAAPAAAQAQPERFLGKEDILLYGLGLRVEPETQTVPKDIATIVSTYLQAPTMPNGELPPFAADAEVRAVMRGPSFPAPVELRVRPNTPFNVPPLTVPGTHTIENIRLVSNGEVLLYGSPESVKIEVIEKLLVTQITARALTADEIREKGIVFDRANFQAYNFTAAFAVTPGQEIRVNIPVLLPNVEAAQVPGAGNAVVPVIDGPSIRSLQTIIPDTLKLQTQIPNLQVVGFQLKVPTIQGQNFYVPPIPGVIVIPGDIGFLNQYFSVMLMVSNVAPDGSNLVVTDLNARIVLPPGNDNVVGTNDDPLDMAQIATGTAPGVNAVTQPGADGRLGTADDITALAPGQTGSAEFLVEGRREGSHVVEMELEGTLNGLPIGPVTIRGRAAGAVLVRNPRFTLTFTHPDVVVAGEPYTLDVTVTNTTESPANFVGLNLFEANIAGATLVGEASRQIDMIGPNDSATVTFDLISRVSGRVTAGTLDSDEQVQGRFLLKTAVGELGVPLSPDSLVLPREANSLPKPLRDASLGLLGKAWAAATAPPAALPRDLLRFSRKVVLDRAVELAAAGLRVSMGEPVSASAAHLLMEFDGSDYARLGQFNTTPDDLEFAQGNFAGFDDLRRKSVRGDMFADAVGRLLGEQLAALGASSFHFDFAERMSYRPGHLSIVAMGAGNAPPPVDVVVRDDAGHRTGEAGADGKIQKLVPFSDWLPLRDSSGNVIGTMALVTTPAGNYTIELVPDANAPPGAQYTLSVVLPNGDGTLRQVEYAGLTASDLPTLNAVAGEPHHVTFENAGATPRAATSVNPVPDAPPSILAAVQQPEADIVTCEDGPKLRVGRILSLLFSEEVTPESIQDKLKPEEITTLTADGNRVVGVALQPGRRIAFVALRDPIGPFVPATITASGLTDTRGHVLAGQTVPIEIPPSDPAGRIAGQVLRADGTPVPLANVRLFYEVQCADGPATFGISSKNADADGRFTWDYVLTDPGIRVAGVDPDTDEFRDVRFRIARASQVMNVAVVFLGRGTLEGRALAEDGVTPLRDTYIKVTSLTDQSEYGARTEEDGRFRIARIPVGNIVIEAVNPTTRSKVLISERIPAAGAIVQRDLVLIGVAEATPGVDVRYGTLTVRVLRADGVTPAPDVPVYAYYQNFSQTGVRCPLPGEECPIATGRTDTSGTFVFEHLVAGSHRITGFDQEMFTEGEARAILPADGTTQVAILFGGGLGTVRGTVLDPTGAPVAGARVGGGLSLTTTDALGRFVLDDVPVGHRQIVAVSDALFTRGSVAVDIVRGGDEVGATIVLSPVGAIAGTVFAADGATPQQGIRVYALETCEGKLCVVGEATSDEAGRYRMDGVRVGDYRISAFAADFSDGNIVPLSVNYHRQVVRADVVFRGGGGRVTGTVYDDDGVTPLKAAVSISGDQVVVAGGRVGVGFQYVQNYRITQTSLTTGRFSFSGVLVGPFTVRAAGQFSPDPISVDSAIPSPGAVVDLRLALQPTSSIHGTLLEPDGVTPVRDRQVPIRFKSNAVKTFCSETSLGETKCISIPQGIQELTVVTNDEGEFGFPIVNGGPFTLTAEDAATGRTGEIRGTVRAGETATVDFRLVGRGAITVHVYAANRDANGNLVPIDSANVEVAQADAPQKRATGVTGPDGSVRFGGADAFGEGQFAVSASYQGYSGRAQGRVTQDGEEVAVTIFLGDSSGSVSGQVFRADGLTPVANGEVAIYSGGQLTAFALTDGEGHYAASFIPLGLVRVEVFEAATGQRGVGEATIFFNAQDVAINVRLEDIAVVRGSVLLAPDLSPLRGWTVQLSQTSAQGRPLPSLVTTTGVDGGFSFPGAAVGAFQLSAGRPGVDGAGSATGVVQLPGEAVDVPIVVTVARASVGRVAGAVLNPDGTPAANVGVTIAAASGGGATTSTPEGTFVFENIGLGRFTLTAQAQLTRDAGVAVGEVAFDGATSNVVIVLAGLSQVTGTVYRPGAGGTRTPAAGAEVTLVTSPSPCQGDRCTTFADTDGRFAFVDLPSRVFTAFASDPVTLLRGSAGGTLTASGTTDVEILLEPSGRVTGVVHSAAGQPKPAVVAELHAGQRRLFVETDDQGRFTFPTVALGTFALDLSDPLGTGVASRQVVVNGAEDLGTIALDEAAPAVILSTPIQGAIRVPLAQEIVVTFSEPVDIGSVSAANLALSGPAGSITSLVSLSTDQRVATVTPLAPLAEQTRYTLRVSGVRDLVGKTMKTAHVLNFTTVDLTPPSVTELSPGMGASGVPIYSAVRVKFSEPVDPAAFTGVPIVVAQAGTAVDGRIDFLFGNSVVVFSPNRPLTEDAVYQVTVAAAADTEGNRQALPLSFPFSTTDRTPPVVTGLSAIGGPAVIENQQKQVVADVGAAFDVGFVDFFINGTFVATVRSAPYALTFQAIPGFGHSGDTIVVGAIATDTSGNRGVATTLPVPVVADQAPAISLNVTTTAGGLQAANGQRVNVSATATDDVGVAQIAMRGATGDARDAAVRTIAPPSPAPAAQTFGFDVPMSAVPGATIAVEATATDTSGKTTVAVPILVTVLDGVRPTVQITGTSSGARVRPGQQVTVVVAGGDIGGVARVGFTASGAASTTETRDVSPAQNSVATSFTFTVSSSAQPNDLVFLDAFAEDRAGNRADASRVVLAMADAVPPTVTLRPADGRFDFVPGRPFSLIAEATDETGVARITLSGSGAFALTDAQSLSPPVTPVSATFTINAPASLTAGQTLTLRAQAIDLSGNASTPAEILLTVRTLSGVTLPASTILLSGESQSVTMTLAEPAGASGLVVNLASSQPTVASVPALVTFAPGESVGSFALTGVSGGTASINASIEGVQRASMVATVRGGVVRGLVTSEGAPVGGASVTILGSGAPVTTATASDGSYFVEAIGGSSVTVRALNADGTRQGETSAAFNRPGGFAVVNVELVAASTVRGTVTRANGTAVGEGVQVQVFASAGGAPLFSGFTDVDGAYRFGQVGLGQYVLIASDLAGNRGRATVDVISGGQDLQVPIAYLGRGTVTGVVLDAAGAAAPNVPLTFRSSSIFGTAPIVTTNADVDGRFSFPDVFVGSFSIEARDPVTASAGLKAGTIAGDGQTVNLEVRLSPVAEITGTVFRADGVTPVGAGVTVTASGRPTITDPQGEYRFEFLPLGLYTLNVYDASSRARGIASANLATNGEIRVVDVTLAPQGTLVVTVLDSNDEIVAGASVSAQTSSGFLGDYSTGTSGQDGTVVLDRLLAGAYSVTARLGGNGGSASGVLAANTVEPVTIRFAPPAPTATLAGTVFRPNGESPATAGRVVLSGSASAQAALTQDGTFRFERLPLGVYHLDAYDANNVRRTFVRDVVLNADGQVVSQNLTFVAFGSVTGTVFYPGGSSASGLAVSMASGNPVFGGARQITTNTGGVYRFDNVAVGSVRVSTQNAQLGFLGEQTGTLVDDGQLLVLDIVLARDNVQPSTSITGPAEGASFAPGQTFNVSTTSLDNVGVVSVTLVTSGAFVSTTTQTVGPSTSVGAAFSVTVPPNTPPGPLVLSVTAQDGNGNWSVPVTRTVTITDVIGPVVAITSPAANAEIDPRVPLPVIVQASDVGNVAQVAFSASGAASASETRDLAAPSASATETFTVNFPTLPPTGGTLTLSASARDVAGNQANAAGVTLRVRDVVAPTVEEVTPIDGATGVDRGTTVHLTFSELMSAATLTAATIELRNGATPVPATVTAGGDGRSATLTPSALLAYNTLYTVVVGTGVADQAGNGLAAPVAFSFRTVSPDVTSPRVTAISPANNAVDVSLVSVIDVTFSEAIDPTTVTAQSFRVSVGGADVAGTRSLRSGNTAVRFTATDPFPAESVVVTELSAGITDVYANPLADSAGQPLAGPLTFTFLTGAFDITTPRGDVIENSQIVLQARTSAGLGVASVRFTVNGQAMVPVTGPNFQAAYTVPSQTTAAALTILAEGLNAGGAVVAQAQRTVNVVFGLRVSPRLLGLTPGGTTTLTYLASSALDADLVITLAPADAAVIGAPASVTIPAGQSSVDVAITGLAVGNTTLVATSANGRADAVLAVSHVVSQQDLTAVSAPVGTLVLPALSLGAVVVPVAGTPTLRLPLLPTAATQATTVTLISSNTAVALVPPTATVAAGERSIDLTIAAGVQGVATITMRVGDVTREITVYVGTPPADSVPSAVAAVVGFNILPPLSLGTVFTPVSASQTLGIVVLPTAATETTLVSLTSSNPAVASVPPTATIDVGSRALQLPITTGAAGTAVLTLRVGDIVREITVSVGPVPADQVPPAVAAPVGVNVMPPLSLGTLFTPVSASQTVGMMFLPEAAAAPLTVQVSSSNPAVASVPPDVAMNAGDRIVQLSITTGSAGEATITLRVGDLTREVTVMVGPPPTDRVPAAVAQPVGVNALPLSAIAHVVTPVGGVPVVSVQLLTLPAAGDMLVTVTSSNPAVASVQGVPVVHLGDRVATFSLTVGSESGVAVLTLEYAGQKRELVVVVGTPTTGQVPAVTAPVIGVRVG